MNRYIKCLLLFIAIALLAYKSIYFKKLSDVKKSTSEKFDAAAYTKKIWEEQLPPRLDSAVNLATLIEAIKLDPANAFSKYTNAMAVGNYRYAMVKTTTKVVEVNDDDLLLEDSLLHVRVALEFVYGNAIRDASRLFRVQDFPNTTDLNNISEELNKKVRTEVLVPFKTNVKKGDTIAVTGAIEINKEHINWNDPEIIPVRLQIIH